MKHSQFYGDETIPEYNPLVLIALYGLIDIFELSTGQKALDARKTLSEAAGGQS